MTAFNCSKVLKIRLPSLKRTRSPLGYNPSKLSCSETAEKVSACGLVHTLFSLLPTHLWLANLRKLRACIQPPPHHHQQQPNSLPSHYRIHLLLAFTSPLLPSSFCHVLPPLRGRGGSGNSDKRLGTAAERKKTSVGRQIPLITGNTELLRRAGEKKVSPSRHTHHRSRPPDS